MTLEVLAKAAPKEAPAKGGGRTAGERGEAEGFTTALSKAGGSASSDELSRAGDHSASHTVADEIVHTAGEHVRRSVKMALKSAADHLASDRHSPEKALPADHLALDQGPSERALPGTASVAGKAQAHRSTTAGGQEAVDADEHADPTVETATDNSVATDVADVRGAADLLSILAGLSAATNTLAGARSSNGGEGRRGADGNGEKSSKTASDVNGRMGDTMASSDMLEMPVTDDMASGPDRNFRFINAKNGSLNSDLTSAAQSRDKGGSEGKTGMPQTENVMVLDSRRFIGMQSSTNSASLMAAMVGDQSWSAAMQDDASLSNIASQSSSGSVVHTLKLQMTPHDLGTVTATLKMIGDQLHVHLTVETRAAHRQLSEDSSGMLDSLRSQGFTVDQVSISIAPNAETDPQKGQQGSQTGQQQTAGNGERQSSANRNPSGERFSEMTDSRNIDDEASLDNSALAGVGGTGGAHAGQLYL